MRNSTAMEILLASPHPDALVWVGSTLLVGALVTLALHGSLWRDVLRSTGVRRRLREVQMEMRTAEEQRRVVTGFDAAFAGSPLESMWQEFRRRREEIFCASPEDRAPVRLREVADERPLLAPGPRRAAAEEMPRALVALGALLATFSFASFGGQGALQLAILSLFGAYALSSLSTFTYRMLEARVAHLIADLDARAEVVFPSLSQAEFSTRMALSQRQGFEQISAQLEESARTLHEALEQNARQTTEATVDAASRIGDEQRSAMRSVAEELTLSMQRGVDDHLEGLRKAIVQTIDQQGVVAEGLRRTWEQIEASQESQERTREEVKTLVSGLGETAQLVVDAGREAGPLLDGLQQTSERVASSAETVREMHDTTLARIDQVTPAVSSVAEGVDRLRHELTELRPLPEQLGDLDARADALSEILRGVDQRVGALESALDDLGKLVSEEGHELRRTISDLGSMAARHAPADARHEAYAGPVPSIPLHTEPEPEPEADDSQEGPRSEGTFRHILSNELPDELAEAPSYTPPPTQDEDDADDATQPVVEIDTETATATVAGDAGTSSIPTPGSGFAGLLSRYRDQDDSTANTTSIEAEGFDPSASAPDASATVEIEVGSGAAPSGAAPSEALADTPPPLTEADDASGESGPVPPSAETSSETQPNGLPWEVPGPEEAPRLGGASRRVEREEFGTSQLEPDALSADERERESATADEAAEGTEEAAPAQTAEQRARKLRAFFGED